MKRQIELRMIDTDRNGDCFLVEADWHDQWESFGFCVEEGFRSDGVSVPRMFWGLVSPKTNPTARRAGVCHDWVYRLQPKGWTRAMADSMFFSFLRADGFGILRAAVCWLAVRLFGWLAWRRNRTHRCAGCPMDCTKCYRWTGDDEEADK